MVVIYYQRIDLFYDVEERFVLIAYYDRKKSYNVLDIKVKYLNKLDMYLKLKEIFKEALLLVNVKLDDVTALLHDCSDGEITNYDSKYKVQSIMGKVRYKISECGLVV